MADFEVPEPILNSPWRAPEAYWSIEPGRPPQRVEGRRPAGYFYRDPAAPVGDDEHAARGEWRPLPLVNTVRTRMADWAAKGRPGLTRVSGELIAHWRRDGREQPLFFAQLEAAETVIFLVEGRADFLQGIDVPRDEPSDDRRAQGYSGFRRLGCKMATGAGKTTVMGMLASWSILNKVTARADGRFSDAVLVVCPNVTIRNRLAELDPRHGAASLYRTRDLVPAHLMPELARGRVVVWNWHVFEPQEPSGGDPARVRRVGQPVTAREQITIARKSTTMRGSRYMTLPSYEAQAAAGDLVVIKEERDERGTVVKAIVERTRYVESDTALIERVLGREVGGKQNILVFNDEAHHAYRIRSAETEAEDDDEEEDEEYDVKEATVWVDGLDKIAKLRGINLCVDLSATPYYLGRVNQQQNATFPWIVSDFGLTDAIESGMVKIPQLAVRDTTGAAIPGYFNIWRWVLSKLTPAERGARRSNPRPEAILKYADTPIRMLAGMWNEERQEWAARGEVRPPVFILVCKNTKIAKVIHEWLGEGNPPAGIPPAMFPDLRNEGDRLVTIRVDTKVVQETDTGDAKDDRTKWMRHTLDTVGKSDWPRDAQGRAITPEGFEDLAKKLGRSAHPPGRDVRCIVSVGMLTEGWDCQTVTHIVGLRPFMSQLLCEQVVGRGLRRASYKPGDDGRLPEEVAKIFGVPFEVIPFKQSQTGAATPKPKRFRVYALPDKERYAIQFPRVEGYTQTVRANIAVDWDTIATLVLDPGQIPPEVEMKAHLSANQGRPSLSGPGKLVRADLEAFRAERRLQELSFEMAAHLQRAYWKDTGAVPRHVLFRKLVAVVEQYLTTKVQALPPNDVKDVFLAPYFGWAIERLVAAIRPDTAAGEQPELPVFERNRAPGSTADVDYWTAKDVREVERSHVNYVVADTAKWEQQAAYVIDTHKNVDAFVKNAGLNFAIPYFDDGQDHEYYPDFIVRLIDGTHVILETKGYDPKAEVKKAAAERWVAAVNADGTYGRWRYAMVRKVDAVTAVLSEAVPA